MTKAVAEGLPKQRIEEAAAARAAKVDTGETVIVGVNRYRLAEEEEHDFLEVDNARVRAGQIARLEQVRAARDEAAVRAALDALGARARKRRCATLLRLSRRSSARARHARRNFRRAGAGVRPLRHHARAGPRHLWQGARRRALEGRGGGHAQRSRSALAASRGSWSPRWARTATTAAPTWCHRPSPTSASTWSPGPLFQTPRETAEMAVEQGRRRGRRLVARRRPPDPDPGDDRRRCKDMGRADIKVVAGGVIPPQDYALLRAAGVPGDLRPRHQPRRRGRRSAAPARPQPPATRRGSAMSDDDQLGPLNQRATATSPLRLLQASDLAVDPGARRGAAGRRARRKDCQAGRC